MTKYKLVGSDGTCPFCNRPIQKDEVGPYIYPIPKCEAFPDGGLPHEGIRACPDCAPTIHRLQFEQGLVVIGYKDQTKE